MLEARYGDTVRIRFTGRLQDGSTFDSTDDSDPFEFEVGSDDVVTGISSALVGMKAGEKKQVTLSPDEAYGDRDEDLVQSVALDEMPEDVEVGDELTATDEEDEEMIVRVSEITDTEAIIDGNHPLAGETLFLDIELLEIVRA